MKNSHEYPMDDYESGYDADAWERALKEQDFNARNAITPDHPSQEVQRQQGNAWGWIFLIAAMIWTGMCFGYVLDVYWTKQIEAGFSDDFIQ